MITGVLTLIGMLLYDMIKRMKNIVWIFGCLLLFFCGCTAEENVSGSLSGDMVSVRMLAAAMSEGEVSDVETQINEVIGYRFEDGMLKEVFSSMKPDASGILQFKPSETKGTVYFLVNASGIIRNVDFQVGQTTLEDFQNLEATSGEMTEKGMVMSGQYSLGEELTSSTVVLKRSVSRIDLDASFEGVQVTRVVIRDIAQKGYVSEQSEMRIPSETELVDLEKDFGSEPFVGKKETLFYLCEQGTGTHAVEIQMTMADGAWHRLKATLPALKRNTIYTLKVYGNGADARVEVLTDDWSEGDSSESGQVLKGLVDTSASQLSAGVTVNLRGDTVQVPYWKSSFRLALKAETGAEVVINGVADGVKVETQPVSRGLQRIAEVSVESHKKMPGSIQEYIYLDVYEEHIHTGRVVLAFMPNPVKLTGRLGFDGDAVCDFATYTDGELGTFVLPEGKILRVEIDENEAPWMKVVATETARTYRILAGWKPNDPLADGRVQEARLVVSDTDGSNRDVYTVKRQNWGLPVVNVNGTWWCKYNLRGNVKNFSDQILVNDDPVSDGSKLFSYLQTCTDDELLQIMGDQYQAGNPDGLKLVYDGESFYHEGYQSSVSANWGTMAPTTMAPDGYQIPDYNNFRFFTWGEDCNLGYFNPGAFNNNLGQRLNFSVAERNLSVNGVSYGIVGLYDFDYDNAHWTILGLGHQWDEKSIETMTVLFATYGNANKTWLIEGYPKSENRGNWFKYANNNTSKTRTIRCIKTPVEYIYE